MAQAAHTSQFGTKVWDARRVELPDRRSGRSTAARARAAWRCPSGPMRGSTLSPSCHQPAEAVLSEVLSDAPPVLSDRRGCCPRRPSGHHPAARSGRFDELVSVRRETSDGPAAANPNGARTGVVAPSGGVSGQAFDIDASQQIEGRFVEQIESSATLEYLITPAEARPRHLVRTPRPPAMRPSAPPRNDSGGHGLTSPCLSPRLSVLTVFRVSIDKLAAMRCGRPLNG